jgi:hypothetical protein
MYGFAMLARLKLGQKLIFDLANFGAQTSSVTSSQKN